MKKISVINVKGEKVNDITLNENVFGITPNDAVLFDAIRLARNSQRQGTHETKTRSDVSGGGAKPWKQKGTGRARQGSIRSPQWRHGGVVFGPHVRKYGFKMNRKERRLAIKSALAYKALNSELIILNELVLENAKTKEMLNLIKNINADKKVLFVVDQLSEELVLATRNIEKVLLLEASEINVYDITACDSLVVTEAAIKLIEEALGNE